MDRWWKPWSSGRFTLEARGRRPNRIHTLKEIQIGVLEGRVLRQGNLFVVIDDPLTIALDVCDVVPTAGILANV